MPEDGKAAGTQHAVALDEKRGRVVEVLGHVHRHHPVERAVVEGQRLVEVGHPRDHPNVVQEVVVEVRGRIDGMHQPRRGRRLQERTHGASGATAEIGQHEVVAVDVRELGEALVASHAWSLCNWAHPAGANAG
jgi:hypothetical protein